MRMANMTPSARNPQMKNVLEGAAVESGPHKVPLALVLTFLWYGTGPSPEV